MNKLVIEQKYEKAVEIFEAKMKSIPADNPNWKNSLFMNDQLGLALEALLCIVKIRSNMSKFKNIYL